MTGSDELVEGGPEGAAGLPADFLAAAIALVSVSRRTFMILMVRFVSMTRLAYRLLTAICRMLTVGGFRLA
jgi:hypothetical protein